jgi:hypothetical protein
MTQKDYIAIAAVLRKAGPNMGHAVFQNLVHEFADACKKDNPRFKESLFRQACGLDQVAELG